VQEVKISRWDAERTSGMFEKDGVRIRHEQLIIDGPFSRLFLLHFFAPGYGEGDVPEFEAVIRSLDITQ
jgi:hypothetical protein